jgi:predicted outer membrane repeat protein
VRPVTQGHEGALEGVVSANGLKSWPWSHSRQIHTGCRWLLSALTATPPSRKASFTTIAPRMAAPSTSGTRAANVSMRRVQFAGNVAQETGGAIAVETSARVLTLTIRSSTFDSNRAWQGGAISLERFLGNTRFLQGAARPRRRACNAGDGRILQLRGQRQQRSGLHRRHRVRLVGAHPRPRPGVTGRRPPDAIASSCERFLPRARGAPPAGIHRCVRGLCGQTGLTSSMRHSGPPR